MRSMPNFAVLEDKSRHESSLKQQQTAMFVSDILDKLFSASVSTLNHHWDLYLFCTTKVFPKFLLPFESQASFQGEEFGSYDYAPRSLSLVACSLSSLSAHAHAKKTPVPRNYPQIFLNSTTAVIIYDESLRLRYIAFPKTELLCTSSFYKALTFWHSLESHTRPGSIKFWLF